MADKDPFSGAPGADSSSDSRFSLVAGGPFHALLKRVGLLEEDGLPGKTAAAWLCGLAFLLPAIAVIIETLVNPDYAGWAYFRDPTVYARYLFAIFIMIATERYADDRIRLMTAHFRDAGLLAKESVFKFSEALVRADQRSSSRVAEAVVLAMAFVWSMMSTRAASVIAVHSWEGEILDSGRIGLSWGAEVSALSSNTLFLFLLLRWLWRFGIWAALLWRTSRLPLRLVPIHPDRCGGLGFLAIFPGIFSGLVLALSSVIAGAFSKALMALALNETTLWLAMAVWLLLVALIFLAPLLAFTSQLYLAREKGILSYGRLAQGHHLAFHEHWIEGDESMEQALGSTEPSSASDLNATVETVHQMRVFPVDREAVIQLLGAAALPLLLVAAMQMPVGELLGLLAGVLL